MELTEEKIKNYLTITEFEILKKAYSLSKSLKDKELKGILLRRINDVLSIIKYMEIAPPNEMQENYEYLTIRITNMEITINCIIHPNNKGRKIQFIEDSSYTPLLYRTIESIDSEENKEISDIIAKVFKSPESGIIEGENIRSMNGRKRKIFYSLDRNSTTIIDADSILFPKYTKKDLKSMRDRIKQKNNNKANPVVEQIYEEMIFRNLNFNLIELDTGFSLLKEPKER